MHASSRLYSFIPLVMSNMFLFESLCICFSLNPELHFSKSVSTLTSHR